MGYTFAKDYPAVFKFKENQTTVAAAAWTPTTSTRIALTDFFVTNGAAAAGTFQLRFGNVGGQIIMNGVLTASGNVGYGFSSPIIKGTYDQAIFFETATSASTAGWATTLVGFEQD